MESGWNVWVWLVGVVSRRWVWLVGVGGIYGCGCKEVYRFPHTTYPYSSCICSFLHPTPLVSVLFYSSIPTFCSFFKMFFILYIYISRRWSGNQISLVRRIKTEFRSSLSTETVSLLSLDIILIRYVNVVNYLY